MKENFKSFTFAKFVMAVFFTIVSIGFIIPLAYIISISFTSDGDIVQYGYKLLPTNLSLAAYKYIIMNPKQIFNSYLVSIIVTVGGTAASLILSTMLAYTISRPDYKFRKATTFIIFFTMLFNGGLVPTYILVSKYLHLRNNILALILPYIISAWFVLLLKGFLVSIPISLIESAKIDGAKEFRIFFKIILPLSKPALSAVGLLIAFTYWNDWWLSLLYIESVSLMPLQYMLYRIMANIAFISQQMSSTVQLSVKDIPNESARMAMCVLAAGPMLIAFPFFQKYFVKGLTVGAVKG